MIPRVLGLTQESESRIIDKADSMSSRNLHLGDTVIIGGGHHWGQEHLYELSRYLRDLSNGFIPFVESLLKRCVEESDLSALSKLDKFNFSQMDRELCWNDKSLWNCLGEAVAYSEGGIFLLVPEAFKEVYQELTKYLYLPFKEYIEMVVLPDAYAFEQMYPIAYDKFNLQGKVHCPADSYIQLLVMVFGLNLYIYNVFRNPQLLLTLIKEREDDGSLKLKSRAELIAEAESLLN